MSFSRIFDYSVRTSWICSCGERACLFSWLGECAVSWTSRSSSHSLWAFASYFWAFPPVSSNAACNIARDVAINFLLIKVEMKQIGAAWRALIFCFFHWCKTNAIKLWPSSPFVIRRHDDMYYSPSEWASPPEITFQLFWNRSPCFPSWVVPIFRSFFFLPLLEL